MGKSYYDKAQALSALGQDEEALETVFNGM
jgi:hypothetical protein